MGFNHTNFDHCHIIDHGFVDQGKYFDRVSFMVISRSSTDLKQKCGIKHGNILSFGEFCNLDSVKYWRQQLNGANTKNMKNESQLGGTRNIYTYELLGFHRWLCNRTFQYSALAHTGKTPQRSNSIRLGGLEHLLHLCKKKDANNVDFARLIKEYLSEISSTKSQPVVKNAMYAIRSFFLENELNIPFQFKNRLNRHSKKPPVLLSLYDLKRILTVGNIQPIERAVFLCKFQRGLDSATLVDRFNFEAWEQLIRHFDSDDYDSWDVQNTPVPICLVRVKTGFLHTGFLDFDAVMALIEYLKVREDKPTITCPLFVNTRKEPITVNWISRRFHKLVRESSVIDTDNLNPTCTSHELRDLLKSTLIDSGCRPDVADHVLGHRPHDSYEKQALLYPESVMQEFVKASKRINIMTNFCSSLTSTETKLNSVKQCKASHDMACIVESMKKIQEQLRIQSRCIERLESQVIGFVEKFERLN